MMSVPAATGDLPARFVRVPKESYGFCEGARGGLIAPWSPADVLPIAGEWAADSRPYPDPLSRAFRSRFVP